MYVVLSMFSMFSVVLSMFTGFRICHHCYRYQINLVQQSLLTLDTICWSPLYRFFFFFCGLCLCLAAFIYLGCPLWLVGSWFADQELNPGPQQWKHSRNHWMPREFPCCFYLIWKASKIKALIFFFVWHILGHICAYFFVPLFSYRIYT